MFAISSYTALKLGMQALISHSKLICEYEPHILINRKFGAAEGHGENYINLIKVNLLLSAIIAQSSGDEMCHLYHTLSHVSWTILTSTGTNWEQFHRRLHLGAAK